LYRRDLRVEVGLEIEIEAGAERAYFDSGGIESCPLGLHFCQPFQPCLLIGLQVVGHCRLEAWGPEVQAVVQSL
jgi:hypothetical protein